MGAVTSKHHSKRTARKHNQNDVSDVDLDVEQNQQNNHIIKDSGDNRNGEVRWRTISSSAPNRRIHSAGSRLALISSGSKLHRVSHDPSESSQSSSVSCTSNNNNKQVIVDPPSSPLGVKIDKRDFRVVKLKVGIDKKPTSLDERSPAVLKYRTPHFRACATVEIPELGSKQGVRIGWIQTCTKMRFVNNYGMDGITSWEFPEIVTGKYNMISDADGKQYPWYGSKHEVQTVQGPSPRQTVSVHMNDNFFPQITWYIPHNSYDRTPRLTCIHRKQNFLTFLVLKDLSTDKYHVIRALTWSMVINIDVKPENPLGKRTKLLEPLEQAAPKVLSEELTLHPEVYALKPPNANNSQTLVWRPLEGSPKVVVPPEETTVDLEKYVIATRDYIRELMPNAPET